MSLKNLRAGGQGESKEFKTLDPGVYLGLLYRVIDLGKQESDWGPKEQLHLSFEFPEDKMDDGQPYTMTAFSSQSLSKGPSGNASFLRKTVAALTGRTDIEDDEEVNLESLLGKGAQIQIGPKGKKGKIGIINVMPLRKGTTLPKLSNEAFVYDLESPDRNYDQVPEGIKRLINKRVDDNDTNNIPF
jgi:hypothetical protein